MIRLFDLLYEDLISDAKNDDALDNETRDTWRTDGNLWGARNTAGQTRYFDNREDATKFARGEIKGPHAGRAEPKETPKHKEPVQKYDTDSYGTN